MPQRDIVAYDSPETITHAPGLGGFQFPDPTADIYEWRSATDIGYTAATTISTDNPPSGETSFIRSSAVSDGHGSFFLETLVGPRLNPLYGEVATDVNGDWEFFLEPGQEYIIKADYRVNALGLEDRGVFAVISAQENGGEGAVTGGSSSNGQTLAEAGVWITETCTGIASANTIRAIPWIQADGSSLPDGAHVDISNIQIIVDALPDTLYIRQTGFRFPYQKWT